MTTPAPRPPPVPDDEDERLAALRGLTILDTDAERAFDDLVALAADLIHVPIALVSLVDEHRQWFKARVGLEPPETPREVAFCAHAILDPTHTLEVPDAREDERFAGNPLVLDDPNIRFYAGAPLVTAEGFAVGTLCVIDREPRRLDEREHRALRALADQVATQLELRRVVRLLDEQVEARQRSELVVREALAQAEDASRLKSAFLAMMSHEIRTPLNGVLGMTGVLLSTDLTDDQRECAEVVRRSGESLLVVLNDLLDLSKIEAGRIDLEIVDYEVRPILNDVVDLSSDAARRKGMDLHVHVEDTVPAALRGDPFRLRQVLTNLVANAVKFTDAGGVHLHADVVDDGRRPAVLRLRVIDSGIGIDPDEAARLFEPFTQANASVARRFGGTGLGLAICKQLVELLGGSIGVTSAAGRGSTFWVELPLVPATGPVPVRTSADVVPMAEAAGRTVLIAEDNRVNQLVMRRMLGQLGFAVDVVADGHEAVRAVETRPYDLVLMDLNMPELDGAAATRLIRAAGHADLPVVALTASALPGDRDRCLEAGMDAFLTKPLRGPELAEVLKTWLQDVEPTGRAGGPAPGAEVEAGVDLLDPVAFETIRSLYDDDDVSRGDGVQVLIDEYASEAAHTLGRLGEALGRGDADEARSLAHRLAGSSATLGARALATELRSIEAAGRAGQLTAGADEGVRLRTLLDATIAGFDQLVRDAARRATD